jgi:hypothetical protein
VAPEGLKGAGRGGPCGGWKPATAASALGVDEMIEGGLLALKIGYAEPGGGG